MVNRVVSTKLTEEEHTALLDACSTEGVTPSFYIKGAIMERLGTKPVADSMSAKHAKTGDGIMEIAKLLGKRGHNRNMPSALND